MLDENFKFGCVKTLRNRKILSISFSMVELWTKFSLHIDTISSSVSSFVRTMSMLKFKKAALDLSQFLRCLQNIAVMSRKQGFDLFQQQGASEIMSFIFEELCGELPHA